MPNKSIDARRKQLLCFKSCLFIFSLRVSDFLPRHFNGYSNVCLPLRLCLPVRCPPFSQKNLLFSAICAIIQTSLIAIWNYLFQTPA
jgi:hypothetical protein